MSDPYDTAPAGTRFLMCGYDAHPKEFASGDWVRYSDYARLKAEVERLRKAGDWQPLDAATWDVLFKGDKVALSNEDGTIHIGTVVDCAGQLSFNDKYDVPLMPEYDGFTHWIALPKSPSA